MSRRWPLGVLVATGLLTSAPAPAAAYEFEVRARTIGQGSELRALRLFGPATLLNRRRFTQTLSLSLWDLGARQRDRLRWDQRSEGGPNVYFTTYLRIEHDFGAWTNGDVQVGSRLVDAIDLIPELEPYALTLDVLYGFLAVEDLWDGRVDLYVGRQLAVDSLEWWSMDGVTARVETPWRVAVEGFGGLRVRDASFAGSSVHEPDGTAEGRCEEYVEGPVPGSGSWRPIDRDVFGRNDPFRNDFDLCPQRERLMPTFGGALSTTDLGAVWARLSYRRSVSPSAGIIGPADRFEYPDLGFYPNEVGQTPGWGTNEELLAATVRSQHRFGRDQGRLTPQVGARYSVLHGLVDEAHASVRLTWRAHSLQPELFYDYPLFDGDSIFNVFAIEPYTDARITYDLAPEGSPWRSYGRLWGRRFHGEAEGAAGDDVDRVAGGVQAGAGYLDRRHAARLDLFHEGGYGGRRTGGHGYLRWGLRDDLSVSGRLSLIDFAADQREGREGLTFGAQVGGTKVFERGVALHLLAEENSNRIYRSQFRLIAVLDLAFAPEL